MIKISINANRSDIAGYISYYAVKELAPLLEVKEEEIVFEAPVIDFFRFGDIDFSTRVEASVVISEDLVNFVDEINDILTKYLAGFVTEFDIRYEVIPTSHIYSFKVAGKEKEDDEEHECDCDECHHDDHEHECHCDECHCDDHEHECHCKDGGECTCGDDCKCGDECHCKDHDHECHCKDGGECTCGDDCKCGDDCTCHKK